MHQEQKELKELINRDRKLRQEDQETQSTAYMFEDPKSKHKAQIIQRIKQAEEIKEMYKKIKHMPRMHKQRVSRVQVPCNPMQNPKECTEWRMINTPCKVE